MPIIRCRALAGRLVIAPVVLVARYVNLAKILAPFEGQAMTAKNLYIHLILSGETEKLHFHRRKEDLVIT